MKWMKRIVMRRAMRRSGAVPMTCPHCGKKTPVYLKDKEGGAASTICLYCQKNIQVNKELVAVKEKVMLPDGRMLGIIEIS